MGRFAFITAAALVLTLTQTPCEGVWYRSDGSYSPADIPSEVLRITVENAPVNRLEAGQLSRFTSCEFIQFDNTNITQIELGAFRGLTSLTVLDLSYNNISHLKNGTFQELESLEYLNINHNRLSALTAAMLTGLTATLEGLRLRGNTITVIGTDTFQNMTKLRDLSLMENELETLTPGLFQELEELYWLHLDENPVTTLHPETFKGLKSLGYLTLDGTRLQVLDPNLFQGLTSLISISLTETPGKSKLQHLPTGLFRNLTKLETFWLRNSRVQILQSKVFEGLSNAEDFYLEDNEIEVIEPGAFQSLTSVRSIWLNGNRLKTLEWNAFDPRDFTDHGGRPNYLYLQLEGNPLICDERIQWMKYAEDELWLSPVIDRCMNYPNLTWDEVPQLGNSAYSCEVGQLNDLGALQCEDCGYGFYQSQSDAFYCDQCPGGLTTLSTRSTDLLQCRPCDAGAQRGVSSPCEQCAVGSYRAFLQSFCQPCPDNLTTVEPGATSAEQCALLEVPSTTATGSKEENEGSSDTGLIVGMVFLVLILLTAGGIFFFIFVRRRRRQRQDSAGGGTSCSPIVIKNTQLILLTKDLEPDLAAEVEETWINPNRITRGHLLGSGNYGLVWAGDLELGGEKVEKIAMKKMRGNPTAQDLREFLQEAVVMRQFNHPNVLSLTGVSVYDDVVCVVMPFMSNGDLKTYMRKKHESFEISDMFLCCLGVAQGMEHLASQKFVHRDLAARNCMLDSSLVVKVSDFGLARDVYNKDYYRIEDRSRGLPIRWMSLESMQESIFTTKSDVWSYGVLLWEIFTRGGTPYPGLENLDIQDFLRQGGRLSKPSMASDFVYNLMLDCWSADPKERPTFQNIVTRLNKHGEEKFGYDVVLHDEHCGYLQPDKNCGYLNPVFSEEEMRMDAAERKERPKSNIYVCTPTHSSVTPTHSSVTPTHSSVTPTHSDATASHSSVTPTHSVVTPLSLHQAEQHEAVGIVPSPGATTEHVYTALSPTQPEPSEPSGSSGSSEHPEPFELCGQPEPSEHPESSGAYAKPVHPQISGYTE